MKVSVFIPCIPEHWWNISSIIECYKHNTVQPDEIVVLISNYQKLKKMMDEIRPMTLHPWQYRPSEMELKIVKYDEPYSCAYARSKSRELCSGEFIIQQDADDSPTTNRIEVIKTFLEENTDTDILLHSYKCYHEDRVGVDDPNFHYRTIKNNEMFNEHGDFECLFRIHDGAHVVRRGFLDVCQYATHNVNKMGEDTKFLNRALHSGQLRAINIPLYIWRNEGHYYLEWLRRKTLGEEC